MALIPPFFLNCVVAIGFLTTNGTKDFVATGFLYGDPAPQEQVQGEGQQIKPYYVYLVTNRHVFEGQQRAFILFNPIGTEPARDYELPLVDKDNKILWFAHPDPDIDIAIIRINPKVLREEKMQFSYFHSDEHILDLATAKDIGLTEGDGVFVLGFPMRLVGKERNYAIVREGSIARIQDALAETEKEFIIDSFIFPGNSGGPVINKPELLSIEGTKKAINTAYLIGVVKGFITYKDVAISEQTKRPRIVFEENSGLTVVIPMHFVQKTIMEFISREKEQKLR